MSKKCSLAFRSITPLIQDSFKVWHRTASYLTKAELRAEKSEVYWSTLTYPCRCLILKPQTDSQLLRKLIHMSVLLAEKKEKNHFLQEQQVHRSNWSNKPYQLGVDPQNHVTLCDSFHLLLCQEFVVLTYQITQINMILYNWDSI